MFVLADTRLVNLNSFPVSRPVNRSNIPEQEGVLVSDRKVRSRQILSPAVNNGWQVVPAC